MLPYIVLIILQALSALFFGPILVKYIPLKGDFTFFVYAVIFAIIIWLIGQIGGEVLKGVARPSGAVLTYAIIGGLIFAGLLFIPGLVQAIPFKIPQLYWPLVGAMIGYFTTK